MKTHNVKWILALVTAMSQVLIAIPAIGAETKISEGKIAIVNGSVITQKDFYREMAGFQQRYTRMERSFDDSQLLTIKKKILEHLINVELLYQETQKKGITVGQSAIDEHLKIFRARFPDEEQFKNALSKVNLSEVDLRSQIKIGLIIKHFIDKQFAEKVKISAKETKAYYEKHLESFKQDEQVRASHILIKVNPPGDESQKAVARKKIKEIQHELHKGKDFAALAREYSEGPSSSKGGDIGFFSRGQMVKPFEDAVFSSAPGQVSDIVETRFGYHLIKVTEKKPQTILAYVDIKDKLQEYLKQKKVQLQLDQYIAKLKGKAKVERFLTEQSK